ncbi:hypothetical protein [uncultured Roseobacter sp.]|uniref:hypothetical protein n=1 Tax=uncultured Roseobacter sp. TaxID=114847 RepID=UPI002611D3FA|nr:hypothetical protein [uncultured Roseobacter sp.]
MPWIVDATAKFDQLQSVNDSIYRSYLRVSSQKAHEPAQLLQSLTDDLNENWETKIEAWRIAALEAIGIVGIAYSVIGEMLRSMPDAPATTASPPAP